MPDDFRDANPIDCKHIFQYDGSLCLVSIGVHEPLKETKRRADVSIIDAALKTRRVQQARHDL
jgi:hypothetical protein